MLLVALEMQWIGAWYLATAMSGRRVTLIVHDKAPVFNINLVII